MTRLTISHYMPFDHGTHVDFILPWTERVKKTCPTLEFDIHGEGSPLGKLENQFAQVASGAVDISHSPASLPAGRFPLTNLMNLPFLVPDAGRASELLWAAHEAVLSDEFHPLRVLALHADSGGVLHLRHGGLRGPGDLAGKRIRTPAGAIAEAMRAIGAEPVQILPPYIGEAARKGEIDGAVMAWDVLAYTGTQDIFRQHYSDVFYVSPLYLVMNPESHARLTTDERSALEKCSGADLAARFGGYWQSWSASGRALAQGDGHDLRLLPGPVLAALRMAAAKSSLRHVEALAAAGVRGAHETLAILSDGAFASGGDHR